jgi:hypothetical protein
VKTKTDHPLPGLVGRRYLADAAVAVELVCQLHTEAMKVTTRTFLVLVCTLVGVVVLSSVGAAAPSYFGYTGLIRVPTAEALSEKEFNVGGFWIDRSEFDDPSIYLGNLGVSTGVEVGVAGVKRDSGADDIFLNGKFRFQRETESSPAYAAGVIDLASQVDSTVYFVASKGFGKVYETPFGPIYNFAFHGGFGGGLLDGFFGGVEANLSPNVDVMLEYDTDDWNVGARFLLAERRLAADIGLFDWSDLGYGISYTVTY